MKEMCSLYLILGSVVPGHYVLYFKPISIQMVALAVNPPVLWCLKTHIIRPFMHTWHSSAGVSWI